MSGQTLQETLNQYQEWEAKLIDSEGLLTEELSAELERIEYALCEKLDGYAGFIAYLKGQAEYLKSEAEQYTSRAKTLLNSVDGMRERMLYAITLTGESKVKTEKHSYSTRVTQSWKINYEKFSNGTLDGLILEGLAERTFKVDMKGLKDAYKERVPEYVDVIEKQSLTIR